MTMTKNSLMVQMAYQLKLKRAHTTMFIQID